MGAKQQRRHLGGGIIDPTAMKRTAHIIPMLLLVLASCHKDDVDIARLSDNPFDPDYEGPLLFLMGDPYVESPPGSPLSYQVFPFTVREDLLLAPATYRVRVGDTGRGTSELLSPNPPGSNSFKYYRPGPEPGQEICLELRLSNNENDARPETTCATLP